MYFKHMASHVFASTITGLFVYASILTLLHTKQISKIRNIMIIFMIISVGGRPPTFES